MSETPIKKQALLIGINQYAILSPLKYARQDAECVADSLKKNYCFSDDEVILLTDAKPGLFKPINRRVIEKHLEKLADQDFDLFIFGFWGHGLFRNGQRYFCPLDAIDEDIEELGLSFDSLQKHLSNIKAKNTFIILDCSQMVHDRGEVETLTAADQAIMEKSARDIILKRKGKEPGFQSNAAIFNSCKQGQAAYEWDSRQHGIFTAHLLDAMNRRLDSVAQIASYVTKNVEKTAMELGKMQTPLCRLEGDIPLPVAANFTPIITGDVFISYRHCNADLVAPVEAELKRRGITYFLNRVGDNYDNYSKAITKAISASKVLLLFWTPEVKGSDRIVNEVVSALKLKKTVISYKIGAFSEVEHSELFYHIAHFNRYKVAKQTPESVVEIVNRIEQALTVNKPELVTATPVISSSQSDARLHVEVVLPSNPKRRTSKSRKNKKLDGKSILTLLIFGIIAVIILIAAISDSSVKKSSTSASSETEIVEQSPTSEEPLTTSQTSEIPAPSARNINQLPKRLPDAGKEAGERAVIAVNGVAIAFRWCPEGEFTMGSPTTEPKRETYEEQHDVAITDGFWMMETEVTIGMFKAFVKDTGYKSKGDDPLGWTARGFKKDSKYSWRNPGFSQDDSHPVVCVSWNDAIAFCDWLKDKTGQNFQLPSESQWEYACRAGTTTAYAGTLRMMAWYQDNSGWKTHPAGTKKLNAWGLYDMHGNVCEWTSTECDAARTIRGGCWAFTDDACRSAWSGAFPPTDRVSENGFRCAMLIDKPQEDISQVDIAQEDLKTPGELEVPESLLNMSTEWKAPETDQPEDQHALKQLPDTGSEAGERAVVTVNGVEFAFRWCPPGTFTMGSPESEEGRNNDEKQHQVTLTRGFWIMETEVTQKQWKAVMGDYPKRFPDDNHPVGDVSWDDCQAFCQKTGFQLPTEAQWEYACRAGTTEAYSGDLDDMAWYENNSGSNKYPVGKMKPNAWGLYDMYGNVMEWCQDRYNYSYSIENANDPAGSSKGALRVIRGGSFFDNANNCRSASRSYKYPDSQDYHLGFRCVSE